MTCLAIHYMRYRLFGHVFLIRGWAERLLPMPSLMMQARPSVSNDFHLDCSVDADWMDASWAAVTDSYDGKLTRTAWLACVGGHAHSQVD